MNDLNNKKDNFWSIFGKISAIIILISAVVTIFQFASSRNNAKIVYSIKSVDYHKSPEKRVNISNFSDMTRGVIDIENFIIDKNEYETIFGKYLELEIQNMGKKPASDLFINFPFDGVYYLIYHNGEIKKGEFVKQVIIGSLKINEKCNIYIWTKKYQSTYGIINYAYDTGSGKIDFPFYTYNSFYKHIFQDTFFFVFYLVIFSLLVFLIAFVLGVSVNKVDKSVKSNDENQIDNIDDSNNNEKQNN